MSPALKRPVDLVAAESELATVKDRLHAITDEIEDVTRVISIPVLGWTPETTQQIENRHAELIGEQQRLTDREFALVSSIASRQKAFAAAATAPLRAAYLTAAERYAELLRQVHIAAGDVAEVETALRDIGFIQKKPIPLPYARQVEASIREIIRDAKEAAAA
jgi:hypothetical protein